MLRVAEILKAWKGSFADDILLDYQDRHRRRIVLTSSQGNEFMLDLADVPDLRDGDALKLSTGEVIMVRAAPESLMEISCTDPLLFARLAWHLGNRHLPTEIGKSTLLIHADHVIEEMIKGLGGSVRRLEAPFNPEGGAYAAPAPSHSHAHDDHDHSDHDHHHGNKGHYHHHG